MGSRRLWPAILLALLGCGKKPEVPASAAPERPRGPASHFSAGERGFAAMWTALREGSDAEAAALWRDLHPAREDFRKILNDESCAKIAEYMASLWERSRNSTDAEIARSGRPRPGWNLNEVDKATTEDLRDQTEAGRRFKPEMHAVARKALKPGIVFYKIHTSQMFFHDGVRWIYTGHLEWYVE